MQCISCGQHYKLSINHNDPLECEDCSGVISEDYYEDDGSDPIEVTREEFVIGDGCYRTVAKRYE